MFMDESDKVVEKSKSKSANPSTFSDMSLRTDRPLQRSQIAPYQQHTPSRLPEAISYQPLNDIAINFFMDNYVGIDSINSQFDYLPDLYKRDFMVHSTIRETIKAVGIAGYAKATRYHEVLPNATKSYISAIKEVNTALSHPELRVQDSTIAAILLLAMFEMLVMPRYKGFNTLTSHLNGALSAAALLLEKGTPSSFSRKIMQSICQAVVMNCWVQNMELPSELAPIRQHLARTAADRPGDFQTAFLELILMLIHSRNAILKQKTPRGVITEAKKLDQVAKQFLDNLPAEGQFTSIRGAPNTELTLNGYYHIYPRNWTAHFWNILRSVRIHSHTLISKQCNLILDSPDFDPELDARPAAQLELSKKEINTLAIEVCASVPQLAGYLDQLHISSPKYLNHEYEGETQLTRPKSPNFLGPRPPRPDSQYHLLYQLRRLAATPGLEEDSNHWIENRIQWVESVADPDDKSLLKTMLEVTPSGAFPFFVNK